MSEENKNLPAQLNLAPQQITKPTVQAFFNTELVRRNYKKILQAAQIMPTKDNIKEAYSRLKDLDTFTKDMEIARKLVSDPYFKAQKDIKATFDEIMQPILAEVERLKAAIKAINDELSAELAAAALEKSRIQRINETMISFINETTKQISAATDDSQLVVIQKRVGSEKSRSNFYQEFTDDFKTKCDSLTPLINQRKETIRKGAQLLKEQQEAISKGDIEKASEIKSELELLDMRMEENVLRIQQTAFEQAADIETIVGEPVGEKIKGRNLWKWRVDDIKKLYQKNPHLVNLEPNKEAIEKILSENRKQWIEDGKKEVVVDGITFFIENRI